MRRLFVFLLFVIAVILGVGLYRGWFTVDREKIQEDEQRAKQEVQELVQEVKAKTARPTKAKEGE
jgi:cell division protein FtsB